MIRDARSQNYTTVTKGGNSWKTLIIVRVPWSFRRQDITNYQNSCFINNLSTAEQREADPLTVVKLQHYYIQYLDRENLPRTYYIQVNATYRRRRSLRALDIVVRAPRTYYIQWLASLATISSTVDRATATRYRSATKGRSRALRALRGTTSSGRGPWYLLHLVAARFARSRRGAPPKYQNRFLQIALYTLIDRFPHP